MAHPAVGIALLDRVPDATPNAEARLRRALGAVEFWPDFPGTLPVWHGRIDAADLRGLDVLLQGQFDVLPPLTVAGGPAWVTAVRQALAADPAWEVPGQSARPALPPNADEAPAASRPRRLPGGRRRWALIVVGGLVTFVVGVLSGLALLPAPPVNPAAEARSGPGRETARAATDSAAVPARNPPLPSVPLRAAAITPPATAEAEADSRAAALQPGVPEPGARQPGATPTTQAPADAPTTEATATGAPASRMEAPLVVPPDPASAAVPAVASGALPDAAPPPQEAGEAALPPPPPPVPPQPRGNAPAASGNRPVRQSAAAPPGIDRACSRAVFRYQQGETLSAVDAAHVRNGCATRR